MSEEYPLPKSEAKNELKSNAKGGEVGDVGAALLCIATESPYTSASYGDFISATGWVPAGLHYLDTDEVLVQWVPYTDVIRKGESE